MKKYYEKIHFFIAATRVAGEENHYRNVVLLFCGQSF